jgi:outer membrane receptor protein involved in Fe transport
VGAVFHLTKWLSPYANYAETFNPPSQIQRIDSSFLPPTVAKGIDVGLRGTFLDGRLNVTVLRYVNKEENASAGSTGVGDINNLAAANALGDTSVAGRNIRGFASVPTILTDLRDREAKGYELEAVANLTKQWRLSGNIGLPKVYETNAFRDFIKFYDANKTTLRQIILDAGGLVDANDAATVNAAIPVNERSPDVNGAVNSYNNLRIARQNVVSQRRKTQDQPAVNLFTDYTLGSGRLKGLRVGAGVNYRGKQIIGYRGSDTIVNPANPLAGIDDPSVDAYTPVYSPAAYYTVVATMSYTLRLERGRTVRFDLRVNNLLNDQGPIFGVSTALRPKNGDLTTPARETVANVYSYKTPTGVSLTSTLRF